MQSIAFPTAEASPGRNKWMIWLLAPVGALLAMGAYWVITRGTPSSAGAIPGNSPSAAVVSASGAQFYSVHPMDLDVKIAKDGELQAVNNIEVVCRVEGGSTVQTLVKEGASVKKGDVLITLDSSAIKQKIEDTTLDLQKADADLTTSKEMREIQISQNATNLEAAEVALTLAKLDLQGYVEGSYPQQVETAKSTLELAKLALKNKEENLAQTRALFAKNFVTATDLKTAEQDLVKAQADVTAAQNALEVLTKYTHESDLANKKNGLSQAEQKLVRTQRENAANLAQKTADVQAKQQALEILKRRMERYQEQLDACTITAPADGLVVYSTSGDRNAQNSLQEGTQVRERQSLLRLPDTNSMKCVVRIGEAMAQRIREGQPAKVTLSSGQTLSATVSAISVMVDNSQRWWNPDLREYPVDLTLDQTPQSLKPGMGARTEILIGHADQSLAVPLSAIYTAGRKSFVFLRDGGDDEDVRVRPAEVKLGLINEQFAQVMQGISDGQQVKVLQIGEGQELLDRAGIKVAPDAGDEPGRRGAGQGGRNGRRGGGGGGEPNGGGAAAAAPSDVPPGGNAITPNNGDGSTPPAGGDNPGRRGGGRRNRGGPGRDGNNPAQTPDGSSAPAPAPSNSDGK